MPSSDEREMVAQCPQMGLITASGGADGLSRGEKGDVSVSLENRAHAAQRRPRKNVLSDETRSVWFKKRKGPVPIPAPFERGEVSDERPAQWLREKRASFFGRPGGKGCFPRRGLQPSRLRGKKKYCDATDPPPRRKSMGRLRWTSEGLCDVHLRGKRMSRRERENRTR